VLWYWLELRELDVPLRVLRRAVTACLWTSPGGVWRHVIRLLARPEIELRRTFPPT